MDGSRIAIVLGICIGATTLLYAIYRYVFARRPTFSGAARLDARAVRTVARAEVLGHALHRRRALSARANEWLVKQMYGGDERVQGWVVTEGHGAPCVHFLGELAGNVRELYRLRVTDSAPVEPLPIEGPLSPAVRAGWRALGAARSVLPDDGAPHEWVVVDGGVIDRDGFFVYRLATTTKKGVWVVGIHHRVRVSADATVVEEPVALSKTPLVLEAPTEKGAVSLTHPWSSTPLEHHVYLSLAHDYPLVVQTRRGVWHVENGAIRLLELTDLSADERSHAG